MTLYLVAALIVLIVAYAFILHPILREHPWFDPIYDWVEPIESWLWAKSRTVLLARLAWVPGAILSIHDLLLPALGVIDWNPITVWLLQPVIAKVPVEQQASIVAGLMALLSTALGGAFEWLRRVTTEALDEKE